MIEKEIPEQVIYGFGVPDGAWIVCPNGHRIAQFSERFAPGDLDFFDILFNWTQPVLYPGIAKDEAICATCGESVIDPLHFSYGDKMVLDS